MSSKGNSNSSSNTNSSGNTGSSSSSSAPEPTVISGWEHSTYANKDDRYAYMGKDETTGEPEWLDYGKKSK